MFLARYAILVDGGFLTKILYKRLNRHASADDIVGFCNQLRARDEVKSYELLRIYYYDAYPSSEAVSLPVSKSNHNLAATERFRLSQQLFDQLVLRPDFALRMGEVRLTPNKWKLKSRTVKDIIRTPRALLDSDFSLDAGQKGVDMRIGMDMARLALRDLVRAVMVVTADSDFVPAFKFVRREGVRVLLVPMGSNARVELKQHSDVIIDV